MTRNVQAIALILGAIIVFAAGLFWGKRAGETPDPETGGTQRKEAASADAGESAYGSKPHRQEAVSSSGKSPKHLEIMRTLRAARQLPAASRTTPLLKALEETNKLPLSKPLLDELRGIIEEGEIESSHYVLSLMEQREEKESVAFLLKATGHADREIADRALFALEAVAGTVFQSREQAAAWAAGWQPDPDRVKLFTPVEEQPEDDSVIPESRLPGPRSLKPKNTSKPKPGEPEEAKQSDPR